MPQPLEPTPRAAIDLARVRDALAPVLVAHGVVLVDLEWLTERAGWTLRITIEREGATDASGGVTLDDCADVSRDASAVLDVEDHIPHRYNLEVSSPGLERRLRTPAELVRFQGRLIKVKLARPAPDGQRVLRGQLLPAPEGRIAVDVDGKAIDVPFADVVEARLVFELSPQPKKRPSRRKDEPGARGRAAQHASTTPPASGAGAGRRPRPARASGALGPAAPSKVGPQAAPTPGAQRAPSTRSSRGSNGRKQ